MNGYVVFIEGARHELYAASLYAASRMARELYTGRKKYPSISVTLAELNGSPVTHAATN
jgi:hypothetical protein